MPTKKRNQTRRASKKPARLTRKDKAEPEGIGMIPPPARNLTPARARKWLAEDHKAWSDLAAVATMGLSGGNPEDKRAAAYLSQSIGLMVNVCHRAINERRSVAICSEYFAMSQRQHPDPSLFGLPLRLLELVAEALGQDDFFAIDSYHVKKPLLALLRAMRRETDRASVREHLARRQRLIMSRSNVRIQALRTRFSAIQKRSRAHLRVVLSSLSMLSEEARTEATAGVLAPYAGELEKLRWEMEDLAYRRDPSLSPHPGRKPKGWKPADLTNAELQAAAGEVSDFPL